MDGSLLLWITLALTVFWSVGVYNRLMRMRARGLGALGSVMKHMRVYADLLRNHVLPGIQDSASGDSAQLLAGLQTLEQVLQEATASARMQQGSPAALGQAFDATQQAWRRMVELQQDAAHHATAAVLREQLELAAQRVATAREGFNQLRISYNQALEQFPASLVVTTMGFKPGDML